MKWSATYWTVCPQDADNQMASDALAARKRRMRGLIHDLPSLNSIDDVTALAILDSGAGTYDRADRARDQGQGASRFGFEISSADEASQVVKQSTMSQPADSSVDQRARSMWQPLPSTTAPGKETVAAVPPSPQKAQKAQKAQKGQRLSRAGRAVLATAFESMPGSGKAGGGGGGGGGSLSASGDGHQKLLSMQVRCCCTAGPLPNAALPWPLKSPR